MQSTRNLTKGRGLPIVAFAVGLLLFPVSCQKERKPEKLMSPKDLSGFLVEVLMAEAKLTQLRLDRDSSLRLFTPYEKKLMVSHHIDSVTLKETYRYYLNHPAEFEKIFENVMDTLSLREQKAQAAMRASGTKPSDTIRQKKPGKNIPAKPGLTPVNPTTPQKKPVQ